MKKKISSYFRCLALTDLYCRNRNASTNKFWFKWSRATPIDLAGHQFDNSDLRKTPEKNPKRNIVKNAHRAQETVILVRVAKVWDMIYQWSRLQLTNIFHTY